MFQVNDTIFYGADGICVVAGIEQRSFHGRMQEYYVLRPVHSGRATIYVPTGSEKLREKMRRLPSADEVYTMIRAMPDEAPLWIEEEAARKQAYAQTLREGDSAGLLRLLKGLHLRREGLKGTGRKFHACDERFMTEAEKLICEEFAFVLHLEPGQVLPLMMEEIKREERRRTAGA